MRQVAKVLRSRQQLPKNKRLQEEANEDSEELLEVEAKALKAT